MKTITKKEMDQYSKYANAEEIAADEQHQREQELHDNGDCWGDRRCYFCALAEDIDDMAEYWNNQRNK